MTPGLEAGLKQRAQLEQPGSGFLQGCRESTGCFQKIMVPPKKIYFKSILILFSPSILEVFPPMFGNIQLRIGRFRRWITFSATLCFGWDKPPVMDYTEYKWFFENVYYIYICGKLKRTYFIIHRIIWTPPHTLTWIPGTSRKDVQPGSAKEPYLLQLPVRLRLDAAKKSCGIESTEKIISCEWDTLPETNIAPENRPSQKETSIPTIHFQVLF